MVLRMRRALALVFATSVLMIGGACSPDALVGPDGKRIANTVDPTFSRDIQPLLQERCQTCHHEGGLAPMSLESYEIAKLFAPGMAEQTRNRKMPPWGAFDTDECKPRFGFVENPSLTEAEMDMMEAWSKNGAPKGDEDEAPPPLTTFASPTLREPDKVMTVEKGWAARGTRDQFRCFVLDPKSPIPNFVQAVGFRPGNPQVVHHAIVFTDPKRESLRKIGEDGSYECFGSPEVSETQILYAWAPGNEPQDLGPRVGFYLPADSLLVLQVHYHPQGDATLEDKSTVDLKMSPDLPEYVAYLGLFGNFDRAFGGGDGLMPGMNDAEPDKAEFRIPAGASNHVELMKAKLPEKLGDYPIPEMRAIIVGSHMHYVGRDLKMEIERSDTMPGEPTKECLVQTPQWDFNWQRGYKYDVAIEDAPRIKPGDTLQVRCTYDNTMSNPALVAALREQNKTEPHDVKLGEQTLDEMCLGVLVTAFPNPLK